MNKEGDCKYMNVKLTLVSDAPVSDHLVCEEFKCLAKLFRISNISAYKDEQKRESIVHLPGLSFTHFSRAGTYLYV